MCSCSSASTGNKEPTITRNAAAATFHLEDPIIFWRKYAERLGMLALEGYPTFFLVVWQRQFLGMLSYAYGVNAWQTLIARTLDWLSWVTWVKASSQSGKRCIKRGITTLCRRTVRNLQPRHPSAKTGASPHLWQSWCMKHDPCSQQTGLFTVTWWPHSCLTIYSHKLTGAV